MKLSNEINFNSPLWVKKLCWLLTRRVTISPVRFSWDLRAGAVFGTAERTVSVYDPRWRLRQEYVNRATLNTNLLPAPDFTTITCSYPSFDEKGAKRALVKTLERRLSFLGIDGRTHPHAEELL